MPRNFEKVFSVFNKKYKAPPLEYYGRDPYKTLVSTLLSARTKDDTTFEVCEKKLFRKAFDIKGLSKLETATIEELIYPVGFYKTKAKHLKALANMVISNFGGKIPHTREELMQLPGVG